MPNVCHISRYLCFSCGEGRRGVWQLYGKRKFADELDKNAGTFWMGDTINRILFGDKYSVWNIVVSGYSTKRGNDSISDLQSMIENNAKIMGNPDVLLWGGMSIKYKEVAEVKDSFEKIRRRLQPYDNGYI